MFDGFQAVEVDVGRATIHAVVGGNGPALLLVHGFPQTHVMWHRVASALADRFAVICADLTGYGRSVGPAPGPLGEGYSKREIAVDLVAAMAALGYTRFGVAGHDRGGRVAYRMALDWPDRVTRLALLDLSPTLDQFEAIDAAAAHAAFHWSFLAQPDGIPERLIGNDPGFFVTMMIERWCATPVAVTPEAMAAYVEAFDTSTIAASCADYRAGYHLDTEIDRADRANGTMIECPTLVLWGTGPRPPDRPAVDDSDDPRLAVWRRWCSNLTGHAVPCGHFLPEEAPAEVVDRLIGFFGA